MDKMRMESVDLLAKNIEKLGSLFPECITEIENESGEVVHGVDFSKLRQLLDGSVSEDAERYDFTWVGKRAALAEAYKPIRKTLRPCPEESVDWDNTQNLYIEGDNLDVLKLLQESYLGKVKVIYIDPPYNTGADSFVYPDNFRADDEEYDEKAQLFDEEGNKIFKENNDSNPRFHSDWCSMMYSRLLLARNLLTNDGVVFISIDEHEVFNLKSICDNIFGMSQFITCVVVENDSRVRPYDSLSVTHEFLLMYRKSDLYCSNPLINPNKKFQYHDEQGGFDLYELRNRNSDFNVSNRPNLYYPFWVNPVSADSNGLYELSLEPKEGWQIVYPQESQGIKTVWRWGKDKAQSGLNSIIFGKKCTKGWQVVKKYRESNFSLNSVWTDNVFSSDTGTLEFKKLFENKRVFTYPKPIYLIIRLLLLSSGKDSIVLDFFSGSATTAHAVMQLNSEDGGNRKFIMVQIPMECETKSEAYKAGYKNICEIGKERIRRAGMKIREESGSTELDIGFRVLKVDDSNMKPVFYGAQDMEQSLLDATLSNIKEGRTGLDLLFGCLLDWGLPLSLPYKEEAIEGKSFLNYADGELMACFDDELTETVMKEVAERRPTRVVFRDSCFKDSATKINLAEIFKLYSPETTIKTL